MLCGSERRGCEVSIGGGRTWTFFAVPGVGCVSSGAENLRVVPGLRGSFAKRSEAGMAEALSPMGPKVSMVRSRVFSSRISDWSVISCAIAWAYRIWSTLVATGGVMTEEDR